LIPLYQNDIVDSSTVIIPAGEHSSNLKSMLRGKNISIKEVEGGSYMEINYKLAGCLVRELGCDDEAVKRGIENFKMDRGELKAWRIRENGQEVVFINSFAANDPFSTSENIRIIINNTEFTDYKRIGIFNLRDDRADRSLQWLDYLKAEGKGLFDELYFAGMHSMAFTRKLKTGKVIKMKDPQNITKMIIANCSGSTLVFGLVNTGGTGMQLLEYWNEAGERIEL